jgi:hypothetical protein
MVLLCAYLVISKVMATYQFLSTACYYGWMSQERTQG